MSNLHMSAFEVVLVWLVLGIAVLGLMRVGGEIYIKAADVGADLVGKSEP